jgi:hypothetical protein
MLVEATMHFAAAVVTEEKPTETILAETLAPFGCAAGFEAKWDWYALGGRFSGRLDPHDISETITGGFEYPDDELPLLPKQMTDSGVDALRIGNLKSFLWFLPPKALLVASQWHEIRTCTWDPGSPPFVAAYLGDIDPSAPVLSKPELLTIAEPWDQLFSEVIDRGPDERWISIVDYRPPWRAPSRRRR